MNRPNAPAAGAASTPAPAVGSRRKRPSRYSATRAVLSIFPAETTLRLVSCRDCGVWVNPLLRKQHDDFHAAIRRLIGH